MYIVKLRDDTEYTLEDKHAEGLKEALLDAETPIMVELGSSVVSSVQIATIEPKKLTLADMPFPKPNYELSVLPSGKVCKAQHSIQLEINNIAKSQGLSWPKLIRSKKWREETRQELIQSGVLWCDYKSPTCACD